MQMSHEKTFYIDDITNDVAAWRKSAFYIYV